ncbi:Zn-dependent alcohol dehydrogenase [Mycobacterium intracellulare]|uniref:Zn-dependent alcohol dehydrogenase n=1 Tax=Mycobacterium intracellulare TaxID=1767 RepID=UPI00080BC0BC|nr:Zn-dependent alcohol dehydrogenase [Mycobacterium intracellulare]OCB22478.1 alcohol dehydrogenase [Mycobacterium intracellulare subsp. yongonense]
MKAAVITEFGKPFEVHDDLELDEPRGREILVDVKASGLCHSDLYVATNDIGHPLPGVFGHEVAGVVRAVGPQVTEFKAGDHVVGCLSGFCGRCDRCLTGRPNLCRNYPAGTQRGSDEPSRLRLGGKPIAQFQEISGFAEQVLMHENNAVGVPEKLPFPQAALLGCGVATGAGSAIHSAGVRVGDTVAVIGCGGVGLNVVQGAVLAGARQVIAVDLQDSKLKLAQTKFGATHTINPSTSDVVAEIKAISDGGVDHAFEVIGGIEETLTQAVRALVPGGTAYVVGAHGPTSTFGFSPAELLFQKTALQGVYMGSCNFKIDIPLYADFYLQGRFNLDDLVSNTIRLDQINEAYANLHGGAIARSVITEF